MSNSRSRAALVAPAIFAGLPLARVATGAAPPDAAEPKADTKTVTEPEPRQAATPSSGASPRAGAEPPAEWVEPSGHRVIRLSREPGSSSFYFHQNGYTAAGDKLVI